MPLLAVTGTGTDVGKTYVSALICSDLKARGLNVAYYKPCASGSLELDSSDAGIVWSMAGLTQSPDSLCSYLYPEPLSPHLAARHVQRFASLDKILQDCRQLSESYPYVLVEGAGGIVCPVVHERGHTLTYVDIFAALNLPLLVVASAGLGTINHTVLTCSYIRAQGLRLAGIILNHFAENNEQHQDNLYMIEEYTGLHVLATLASGAKSLQFRGKKLEEYFA